MDRYRCRLIADPPASRPSVVEEREDLDSVELGQYVGSLLNRCDLRGPLRIQIDAV